MEKVVTNDVGKAFDVLMLVGGKVVEGFVFPDHTPESLEAFKRSVAAELPIEAAEYPADVLERGQRWIKETESDEDGEFTGAERRGALRLLRYFDAAGLPMHDINNILFGGSIVRDRYHDDD